MDVVIKLKTNFNEFLSVREATADASPASIQAAQLAAIDKVRAALVDLRKRVVQAKSEPAADAKAETPVAPEKK